MPQTGLFDPVSLSLEIVASHQLTHQLVNIGELIHQLCLKCFLIVLRRPLEFLYAFDLDQL